MEKVSKRWAEIYPEEVRKEGKPGDTKINLEEGGTHWESSTETHILPYANLDSRKKFTVWCKELKSRVLWQPRGVGYDGRWEGGLRGRGHIYTYG